MGKFVEKSKNMENEFLIPAPNDTDPQSIKIKIYFFSTPSNIEVHVSKKSIIGDLIKHIMTLYTKNEEINKKYPLEHADNPEAYELRLIDDDEGYYLPYYEIPALNRLDEVGEFESLAFVNAPTRDQNGGTSSPYKSKSNSNL